MEMHLHIFTPHMISCKMIPSLCRLELPQPIKNPYFYIKLYKAFILNASLCQFFTDQVTYATRMIKKLKI